MMSGGPTTMLTTTLFLCHIIAAISVPLIVSPAYRRSLQGASGDLPAVHQPVPPATDNEAESTLFSPEESEELRSLLRNGDPQAWEVYGDDVDDYLTQLQANGEIDSVEEGLVRLLYPELSPVDVARLVLQTDQMLAALGDDTDDLFVPNADDEQKYEIFTPAAESDLSLEDSLIQKALEAKKSAQPTADDGQVDKKTGGDKSDSHVVKPISDAEMLNFLADLQPQPAKVPAKRAASAVVPATMVAPVPKSVDLKRGQPEVPFFPGGKFKPKRK